MNPKRFLSALLIAALMLIPAGPVLAQDQSIVDIAVGSEDFTTLVTALVESGLADALGGDGPFTVFAPTDDAFNELPEGLIGDLLADPTGDLTQILLYHVLSGVVLAEDISDGLEAETLQGSFVVFSIDGESVMINHADIIATDILASNGVIHVINRVLLPPSAVEDEEVMGEEVMDEEATDEEMDHDMADEDEAVDEEMEMADEGEVPSVAAEDQVSDGRMVTVNAVNALQAGWMVIHLDDSGRPGPVIGQTAVPAGFTENVIVFLEEEIAGDTGLWAMLHVDEGQIGVYEFPGPDVPARVNDSIVMVAFTASAPAAAEEAVEEAMAEEEVAEEEMAEEEVAEEEVMEEEAAEEEMAEEAAPVTLPATGGSMTGAPLAMSIAALLVLVLGAAAFVNRRRLA